ncbi:MAG: hypothetical protein RLZZ141_309 [Pseudomonadota bacterium]
MQLPDFTLNGLTIDAVRRASKRLSDDQRLSFPNQVRALADLSYQANTDTVNRFANGRAVRGIDDLTEKLWDVFAARFPLELAAAIKQSEMEALVSSDAVTNALHHFYLPRHPLDQGRLSQIAGHYAAYVPFFYDHESQIMIMALTCGVNDNPGAFTMIMRYEDEDGVDVEDRVEGVIIPYQENILFMGRIADKIAPYIFALTNFPITGNIVQRGEGALLAAARATIPTASPILICRRDELPTPEVLPKQQVMETMREHKVIERVMKRGNVHWK